MEQGCGDCMSTCCATEGRLLVARGVRHKHSSDALDFREDRLIKLDITKADCNEPVDVEQLDEVATVALVDAEGNTYCNTSCELAELLCFAA
eukprot:5104103-Pleurochrysis_carterae.AAC.1